MEGIILIWPKDITFNEDELPFLWDDEEFGTILEAKLYCPGVYLLQTEYPEYRSNRTLYAVYGPENSGIIPSEALQYGKRTANLTIFDRDDYGEGWMILEFEIYRYWSAHGIPNAENTDLFTAAHYAAEKFPEYFGSLIPPQDTPSGYTIRYKIIANGLYFVESENCRWFLAVAYCIWSSDLSDLACKFGKTLFHSANSETKTGYLFFDQSLCAPAIYELLDMPQYQNLRKFISSQAALENELVLHFPLYMLIHNKMEIQHHGKDDLFRDLLLSLGHQLEEPEETEQDIKKRIENCIRYTPQAENEFWLKLPLILE